MAFMRNRNSLGMAKECVAVANTQSTGLSGDFINSLEKILSHDARTKQIKKECIEASLQREPGNEGYSCNGDERKKFENSGRSTPCLNQKTVDFIHFSVNQAINCMSTGRADIDPRFILKKLNNETAFNFYLAYSGGKGIGQLTSDPVDEIAGWYKGKKFIEGNAFHILEDLMDNTNPSCGPFREIMKGDLKRPPPSPGSARNYCDWIRPGDGVARNLIYSLGYYVHMRDNVIKPNLESRSKKLAKNSDIVNYLTLAAYGPDGPAGAKSLIRRLRLSDSMGIIDAKSKIIGADPYVKQTEKKFVEELLPAVKANPTEADKKGDICLQ